MKEGIDRALLEWALINNRVIQIRLRKIFTNTTIIQCNTSTNDSDEDKEKKTFISNYQKEVKKALRHDLIIIMVDLTVNEEFHGETLSGVINDRFLWPK